MKGAVALRRGGSGQLTSARSKTGDPACSQAMSVWVRGRKGGGVPAEIFTVLARCRAKARAQGLARDHATAGNELKAQVWQKRAERGLSGAERSRQAAELRSRRAAAAKATPARKAAPTPAKAPGRGTPERAARARSLAGMRKQLNNVKADLRHYDAKWGARNDAIDDSRRDRLDELAYVKRQIARARGKKARR